MAAHLMTQRHSQEPNHRETGEKWLGCCRACSSILIPGLSSTTSIESAASSRRTRGKSKALIARHPNLSTKTRPKWLKVTCTICHRYQKTEVNLEKTVRSSQQATIPKSSLQTIPASSLTKPSKPGNLNQSSKQRAKARKQGLSTLLEKSKQSKSNAGRGLDLMDFMKANDTTGL